MTFVADQPVTTHPFYDKGTARVLKRYRFKGLRIPSPFRYYDPELADNLSRRSVRWYKGRWEYGYANLTEEGRALFDRLAAVGAQLPNGLIEMFYSYEWTEEFGDLIRFEIDPNYWGKLEPLINDAFRAVYGDDVVITDTEDEEVLPHPV